MADPVVHITGGLPDSGTGNITTLGQTLLDGANITQGALADAAVTAGATGSISAKLRSISRDIVANIVLAAGTALIGKVGLDQTTPGTTNATSLAQIGSTAVATGSGVMTAGVQRVAIASDSPGIITTGTAGTPSAIVLSVQGVTSMTPLLATITGAANLVPATSGGLSRSRTLIPNNTTAIVVKASAGQVYKIRATNNSATISYIKLYDATSATAGSGTPVDTIMIPAATAGGAGIVDTSDIGWAHATGITYVVTTGIADADTTAPAASAYIVTVSYK